MNSPTVVTLSLVVGAQAHGLGSADFGSQVFKKSSRWRGAIASTRGRVRSPELLAHNSSADCGSNVT